ncbi:MAG: PDDEXK nuclease domain-containing protein [Sumerlaeia bacterium]
MTKDDLAAYGHLLGDIKARVRHAQTRASQAVQSELVRLYWEVGGLIAERRDEAGWGAGFLARLASDLKNELPEVKGFSKRNLYAMVQFREAHPGLFPIVQRPVAQLENPQSPTEDTELAASDSVFACIPWAHNLLLLQRAGDPATRLWYARQTLAQGWSRDTLGAMIKARAHERQGAAVTNFDQSLPPPQSALAEEMLKDPYVFDFLTLDEPFRERELESGLVRHLEKFLLELGQGFAFVGRQYPLTVGEEEFYIDLLFYHLKLRCFVVIELKRGKFRPEYAGKMNFYCSAVDDLLRHDQDQPTIGLILCQTKDRVLAEYALRDIHKPIGVSDYELTTALPQDLASSLPSIAEIEAELSEELED